MPNFPTTPSTPNMHLPKFESISALKHHCGICKTPFSNPNALATCIGKHEVICARYHFMFHFVGKAHTCKACITGNQQQSKRHKEILRLVQRYRKLSEDDTDIDPASQTAPVKIEAGRMKRKERKAQKKSARTFDDVDILRQSDLIDLELLIYPDDESMKADDELAEALAHKVLPNVFADKRLMDALMTPAKQRPDLEVEIPRIIDGLELKLPPQGKTERGLLEKIRTAIAEEIVVNWNSDVEMRRRRNIYAQWITHGAVRDMSKHEEQWELETGYRKVRRFKGDDRGEKSKESDATYDDDLEDIEGYVSTQGLSGPRSSSVRLSNLTKANNEARIKASRNQATDSPLNDKRRGGSILHASMYNLDVQDSFEDDHDPFQNSNQPGDKSSATVLCLTGTPSKEVKQPWQPIPTPSQATSLAHDLSPHPQSSPVNQFNTAASTPGKPVFTPLSWSKPIKSPPPVTPQATSPDAWRRGSYADAMKLPVEEPADSDDDAIAPVELAVKSLRVVDVPIVDGPLKDDGWEVVKKKGKTAGVAGKGGKKKR